MVRAADGASISTRDRMLLPRLLRCLTAGAFVRGNDGIYSSPFPSFTQDQQAERDLRETAAANSYDDYLAAIAHHHSIAVMDYEVDRFLSRMPRGALVLDIGGCWGWHWRRLATTRPDVAVLVIDFVRANLQHAARVLGPLVGSQVALMHADATALPFPDADTASTGFDGIWTVQVFQHIPDFDRACREAFRVLKPGGQFANHSLHNTQLNRVLYWLLRKPFHTEGMWKDRYHLTRANARQRQNVAEIFGKGTVTDRYTEHLFHPDLRIAMTGRLGVLLGRVDARLAGIPWLGWFIARQRGFEARKDG